MDDTPSTLEPSLEPSLRVAVASQDGGRIDQHFGQIALLNPAVEHGNGVGDVDYDVGLGKYFYVYVLHDHRLRRHRGLGGKAQRTAMARLNKELRLFYQTVG